MSTVYKEANIKVLPIISKTKAERPIWSVVIPAYNRGDLLTECLKSVVPQFLHKEPSLYEIWVVDDCSQENLATIVSQYGSGIVQYYRQPKNVGQLNNFETCLNLTSGQLIHLLHSDDTVNDGFYREIESPLLENDTIGAAFCRHNYIDEYGKIINTSEQLKEDAGVLHDFLYDIASRQLIQTPSIVVKRSVYEAIGGFNKSLSWCEDWEMWIRIATQYQFWYIPQVLANYRIHGNSNTGSSDKNARFIVDVLACINYVQTYLPFEQKKNLCIQQNAKRAFLSFSLRKIAAFLKSSNTTQARFLIVKSLKLCTNSRDVMHLCKIYLKSFF
ncbi:MAG TPA: family 2 glycosyl transferase [Chitinophagaceae bacterium]|nr:family 2 glycosyl transferase [Chitinophagaceae bacterium]